MSKIYHLPAKMFVWVQETFVGSWSLTFVNIKGKQPWGRVGMRTVCTTCVQVLYTWYSVSWYEFHVMQLHMEHSCCLFCWRLRPVTCHQEFENLSQWAISNLSAFSFCHTIADGCIWKKDSVRTHVCSHAHSIQNSVSACFYPAVGRKLQPKFISKSCLAIMWKKHISNIKKRHKNCAVILLFLLFHLTTFRVIFLPNSSHLHSYYLVQLTKE